MFCYGSNKKTTNKHCSSLALLGHNTLWSLADIYWTWEPWVPDQHGHLDSGVWESRKIQKPRKQTNKKQKQKNNKEQKKGCYRRLVEYASPEGKFEALHMINENYFCCRWGPTRDAEGLFGVTPWVPCWECTWWECAWVIWGDGWMRLLRHGLLAWGFSLILNDVLWFLMIFLWWLMICSWIVLDLKWFLMIFADFLWLLMILMIFQWLFKRNRRLLSLLEATWKLLDHIEQACLPIIRAGHEAD